MAIEPEVAAAKRTALIRDRASAPLHLALGDLGAISSATPMPRFGKRFHGGLQRGASSMKGCPYHFSPKGRISSSNVHALFGC
jgi:hypothetical protein